MNSEVKFTSTTSVCRMIQELLRATQVSVDAALYRLNHPELAWSLADAVGRGVRIRLVLDRGKYSDTRATRELLAHYCLPFRISNGRCGEDSKMHHKFVILDGQAVLTGSYNWTLESEEQNYENLLVLRDPQLTLQYIQEFEDLWERAADV